MKLSAKAKVRHTKRLPLEITLGSFDKDLERDLGLFALRIFFVTLSAARSIRSISSSPPTSTEPSLTMPTLSSSVSWTISDKHSWCVLYRQLCHHHTHWVEGTTGKYP